MSIYDSKLWTEDIDVVLEVLPELKTLENMHVLITGAAGLVCSAVTDVLVRYNETHDSMIHIHAAGRNERAFRERFSDYFNKDYFHFVHYDASKNNNRFDCSYDYIIHGAANSSPNKIVLEPVETMLGNIIGVKELLDLAKEGEGKRLLFISSSEVYGKKNNEMPFKEGDYGYIDNLMPRNAYSIGKKAAETLCISYAEEYGVNTVIIRPGHIYGPTAKKSDKHVSSSWAYDVAMGKDITMKSDGSQIRSYVYCLDCASAILKALLCGENCHAYNVSNPDSMISIKEMAKILCEVGRVELHMEAATNEEKKSYNPMNNSTLDSSSLINLGWRGCFDAERGFRDTVSILRETAC